MRTRTKMLLASAYLFTFQLSGRTGRAGGRIGRVRFGSRSLNVAVYTDRLTLRGFMVSEYAVHGAEIRSIAIQGERRPRIVIEHTGPGNASPVVLGPLPDFDAPRDRADPAGTDPRAGRAGRV